MGNQGHSKEARSIRELDADGAIGDVPEVHVLDQLADLAWRGRAQGDSVPARPTSTGTPAGARPVAALSPGLQPLRLARLVDYGTGAPGDMGAPPHRSAVLGPTWATR